MRFPTSLFQYKSLKEIKALSSLQNTDIMVCQNQAKSRQALAHPKHKTMDS
jgi:hypothetical protein